jgi:hypothetical protein
MNGSDLQLKYPWVRVELLAVLRELASPDPWPIWKAERDQRLILDIDQVIHFLFDDHDFDAGDIGYSLYDCAETYAVAAVKQALDAIISIGPKGRDDDYVEHPGWDAVRRSAQAALAVLGNTSPA